MSPRMRAGEGPSLGRRIYPVQPYLRPWHSWHETCTRTYSSMSCLLAHIIIAYARAGQYDARIALARYLNNYALEQKNTSAKHCGSALLIYLQFWCIASVPSRRCGAWAGEVHSCSLVLMRVSEAHRCAAPSRRCGAWSGRCPRRPWPSSCRPRPPSLREVSY